MKSILSELTATRIALFGFVLLFVGQTFTYTFMKVELGALLANVGAMFLVIGFLQAVFDEASRSVLIEHVSTNVIRRITEMDHCSQCGIMDCQIDAKNIASPPLSDDLKTSTKFAIGIQYSDGLIARYQPIISSRVASNRHTQITHIRSDGEAATYVAAWIRNNHVGQKVDEMIATVARLFHGSPLVETKEHDCVMRYSFIYSEKFIWITFMTNTSLRQPLIPGVKVMAGSPLYDFFKDDIRELGVDV